MTTNGLIATPFVRAAHDHGMPAHDALVVGIFDVVGTIASGWLTDNIRGCSSATTSCAASA